MGRGGRDLFLDQLRFDENHPGPIGVQGRCSRFAADVKTRDGYKCVVTAALDMEYSKQKGRRDASILSIPIAPNDAAHIIPHSSNQLQQGQAALTEQQRRCWDLLNAFAPQTGNILSGRDIDRPCNGLTMRKELHAVFGDLTMWFEEVSLFVLAIPLFVLLIRPQIIEPPLGKPTYIICHSRRVGRPDCLGNGLRAVQFDQYLEGGLIEPPSPYLLRVHAALARVCEASAAGEKFRSENDHRMDEEAIRVSVG